MGKYAHIKTPHIKKKEKRGRKRTSPAMGASQGKQVKRQDPREMLGWGAGGRSWVLQWHCLVWLKQSNFIPLHISFVAWKYQQLSIPPSPFPLAHTWSSAAAPPRWCFHPAPAPLMELQQHRIPAASQGGNLTAKSCQPSSHPIPAPACPCGHKAVPSASSMSPWPRVRFLPLQTRQGTGSLIL